MEGPGGSLAAGLLLRLHWGQGRAGPCQLHCSPASSGLAIVALTLRDGGMFCSLSHAPASINSAASASQLFLQQRQEREQLSASLGARKASLSTPLWFLAAACPALGKLITTVVSPSICWCPGGAGHPSLVPTAGRVLAKIFKPWYPVYTGSKAKSFWHNKADKCCKKEYKVYWETVAGKP